MKLVIQDIRNETNFVRKKQKNYYKKERRYN